MSESLNIFSSPELQHNEPSSPEIWSGTNLCRIQELHEPHVWTITYLNQGPVTYSCEGLGTPKTVADVINEEPNNG